jgi:hypothetical protein
MTYVTAIHDYQYEEADRRVKQPGWAKSPFFVQ